MSPRGPSLRAGDILRAIEEIRSFVKGYSFEQFANDNRTVKAVMANFSIIGEAVSHLPSEKLRQVPEVDWREVRKMRNVMVHIYFGIDLQIVWQTIHDDLPPLERAMNTLFVPEFGDSGTP